MDQSGPGLAGPPAATVCDELLWAVSDASSALSTNSFQRSQTFAVSSLRSKIAGSLWRLPF
jgi:hypothetical protein